MADKDLMKSDPAEEEKYEIDPTHIIDLVDVDDDVKDIVTAPAERAAAVKLAAFQCVICMDNAREITVTHCGKPSPFSRPARRLGMPCPLTLFT